MPRDPDASTYGLAAARAAWERGLGDRPRTLRGRGRTRVRLLETNETIGLSPALETEARATGSARRLTSAIRSRAQSGAETERVVEQPIGVYVLPDFSSATWAPFDDGRLAVGMVLRQMGWSAGLHLESRPLAKGVWALQPAEPGRFDARVDAADRRIGFASSWVEQNGLLEVPGLLACATDSGLLIVDVRRANFQGRPT